ncbi:hypothetical protein [Glycomyces tenuis]|uniref:hypothetical protein n=1 Tax=Glycomyces tenuis TaxID=58116 RepID=UPI0003FB8B60|nr:hypothetical protein [Glycomyces tenuis]
MSERPIDDGERAELERLRALHQDRAPAADRGRGGWPRWTASTVVLLVAALLALLSVVTVFGRNLLLDTDRYVTTVAPLAEDDEIRAAVAARITATVNDQLALDERVATAVDAIQTRGAPDAVDALSAPLVSAVESFVADKVTAVVYSDQFSQLWTSANQAAHRALEALLTGEESETVSIEGDMLYLDIGPVVEQVKTRLVDSGFDLAANLPTLSVTFPLMEVRGLANARAAAGLLDTLSWALPLAAVLVLAAGVYFAPKRRRGLLLGALFIAAAMLVLAAAIAVTRTVVIAGLPETVRNPQAVAAVYDIVVRNLAAAAQTIGVLALIVAVAAWFTGPGRLATTLRGGLVRARDAAASGLARTGAGFGAVAGFAARNRRVLEFAVVALGLVWLVLWGRPGVEGVLWVTVAVLIAVALIEVAARSASTGPRPQTR